MSKVDLWNCKRIVKRMQKYDDKINGLTDIIIQYGKWIHNDHERLKKFLKKLTRKENIEFGYQAGFIEEVDYQIMLSEIREKAEEGRK